MFSVKSLIVALVAATVAVEGFAPKSFTSPSSTRLSARPDDDIKTKPLPPWVGGHKESNPDFLYSTVKPDLSSEPMLKNLDNMDKITRMQRIIYPEFSWFSKIGDESSRVYTTFAQDVSRIGYDDTGKIWSLVCPQRAINLHGLGTAFIEVTVTGVRGWVDEENRSVYADISVEGNLWIQPQLKNPLVQALASVFEEVAPGLPFPFSKANAVKVDAHQVGKPYEPVWPMTNGTDPNIFQPMDRRHFNDDDVFSVYHLEVEMADQMPKGNAFVDRFDRLLLDLFNNASGGILLPGQRVSWNVWPTHPQGVDTEEWEDHADKWFHSMHNEHQYPDGQSLDVREVTYFDGTEYVEETDLKGAIGLISEFLEEVHASEWLDAKKKEVMRKHPILTFVGRHLGKRRRDHVK